MELTNSYLKEVYEKTVKINSDEKEFLQAVKEVFISLQPVVEKRPEIERWAIMERLVEPERVVSFRVSWVDDSGAVRVNRGWRVQFNSAIGPYKGGLRFHPSVNLSIVKFLGFEQIFKNSLTGLPLGGGKGGSDFDPRGKSDTEIMRFCQSFMTELCRHIGADTDVPAGDLGVGGREIGYLFGQYKRLRNEFTGAVTGKGIPFGGSLARTEATGFGLCYFTKEVLASKGESFEGKRVLISGAGNVGTYANQKATELGGKVVAQSSIDGYVVDEENGIDYKVLEKLYADRASLADYVKYVPTAQFFGGNPQDMWRNVPCEIALPCATQNEIDEETAKAIVAGGVIALVEGANMPNTPEAIAVYKNAGVLYAPGKAANAGGVATSCLEMSQNSSHIAWSFEEVDRRLEEIMKNVYRSCVAAAEAYGYGYDLEAGANIAGFLKVADAMLMEGVAY